MEHLLTTDEIIDLANSIETLKFNRLIPTWSYIQFNKYNGFKTRDFKQSEYIFKNIELPIIKRLFPPELIQKKIKMHFNFMLKETKEYSAKKLKQYITYRNHGISVEKAREKIKPVHKDWFLNNKIIYYSQPYTFKYDIDCRDADLIFDMGIDRFVQLFYDRFYQPIKK